MINTTKQAVVVFYKKRLIGTLLKQSIEEVSMICSSSVNNLMAFQQESPPVTIISCEWLDWNAPILIQNIRAVCPQTYIILCCVQNPVLGATILRPMVEAAKLPTLIPSATVAN